MNLKSVSSKHLFDQTLRDFIGLHASLATLVYHSIHGGGGTQNNLSILKFHQHIMVYQGAMQGIIIRLSIQVSK